MTGMGGRNPPESVDDYDRNMQLCDFLSRETGSPYSVQMPMGRIPIVDVSTRRMP
jgi:hypothetical protein